MSGSKTIHVWRLYVSHAAAQAYVGRSRNKRDRLEAAKELKALVFFSNIVVSALLEDVQARRPGASAKAPPHACMTSATTTLDLWCRRCWRMCRRAAQGLLQERWYILHDPATPRLSRLCAVHVHDMTLLLSGARCTACLAPHDGVPQSMRMR